MCPRSSQVPLMCRARAARVPLCRWIYSCFANFWRVRPNLSQFSPKSARFGLIWASFGPSAANLRPDLTNFDRLRPSMARLERNLIRLPDVWRVSASDSGRTWPDVGQCLAEFGQVSAISADLGPISAPVWRPRWSMFGRSCQVVPNSLSALRPSSEGGCADSSAAMCAASAAVTCVVVTGPP